MSGLFYFLQFRKGRRIRLWKTAKLPGTSQLKMNNFDSAVNTENFNATVLDATYNVRCPPTLKFGIVSPNTHFLKKSESSLDFLQTI